MSDIYINLVIIGIIIALFLAYVLISQFFSNYTDYRDKVNDDLKKTTRYINSTTKTLDNNIKTTTTNMDKLDIDLRSKIRSINNDLTTNMSDLTSARSNITTLSGLNVAPEANCFTLSLIISIPFSSLQFKYK